MFNAEILMPFNMLNEHCRESVMGPTPFTKVQLVQQRHFFFFEGEDLSGSLDSP